MWNAKKKVETVLYINILLYTISTYKSISNSISFQNFYTNSKVFIDSKQGINIVIQKEAAFREEHDT